MLSGRAEAALAPRPIGTAALSSELIGQAPLQYTKLSRGHSFSLGSAQLGNVLVREGLLSQQLAGRNTIMKLSLEWS